MTSSTTEPKVGDRYRFTTAVGGAGFAYQRGQTVALGVTYDDGQVPLEHGLRWIEGGTLIPEAEPLPMPREHA